MVSLIVGVRSIFVFCLAILGTLVLGTCASAQTIEGQHHVSSSNSGTSAFQGIDINDLVGANRFYNSGFTGSSSLLGNIEGGKAYTTHNTATNVTQEILGTGVTGTDVNHAAASLHAMSGSLGGTPNSSSYYGYGVSYNSETWSGDIATGFNSNGSYQLTWASIASTYATMIETGVTGRTVDVFNSSWGFTGPGGIRRDTIGVDGLINNNGVVGVFSAGNSGSGTNTVGGIGAGYNSITVGAVGGDLDTVPYNQVTSFSSRSPNEFKLATGTNSWSTINAATAQRAAIDIVAPGQNMTLASPSNGDNWYQFNWAGTSFAAPTVAGGAGLVVDVGNSIYGGGEAIDGRVVKASLLNAARKLDGWDNGQAELGGIIQTSQSLDFEQGAGFLDLAQTFDQYVDTANGGLAGTTNVLGLGQGDLGDVSATGWDYGFVDADGVNEYYIDQQLAADSTMSVTLSWFADRNAGDLADFSGYQEQHLADLNLSVFQYDPNTRSILSIIAESNSLYNVVEHLVFDVRAGGFYGIQVEYDSAHWNFTGETGEFYGLAWSSTAIPEPGSIAFGCVAIAMMFGLRRRDRV